jgi:hypothetical protein
LDGYAREDVLKEVYNYDNSDFLQKLEKLGFYVINKARSNYIHTYLSLPSTFNMEYLDFLPEKYGTNPDNGSAAQNLMTNNKALTKLKSYGYTSINFASTWTGTDENYNADITFKENEYLKILGINFATNETNMVFLQTTLLSPFIKEVWGDALRVRTLSTLQKLPDIAYQEEKKYILAHFITPHPPYVFMADGKPIKEAELEMADESPERRPKYLGQLTFISNQIIPVIESIIKNSKTPPIIILQSDHGPASIFAERENWKRNYSPEGVKERSSILFAVYYPDQNYENLYQTMTPINIYRMIFNKYFGVDMELLPDKTYYTSFDAIYDFKDITNLK